MKRQQQKHVVEVTKVVEALNELNEHKNVINKDRDFYKTRLEEEQKRVDMLQNSIVIMTQTFQVQELQHAKDIEEL